MVIYSHRQLSLGIVLTNDILVEKRLDICRFRKFLQVQGTSAIFCVLRSFDNDFVGLLRTAIANIAVHTCNQEPDFALRASAKATASFILIIFSQCYFFLVQHLIIYIKVYGTTPRLSCHIPWLRVQSSNNRGQNRPTPCRSRYENDRR